MNSSKQTVIAFCDYHKKPLEEITKILKPRHNRLITWWLILICVSLISLIVCQFYIVPNYTGAPLQFMCVLAALPMIVVLILQKTAYNKDGMYAEILDLYCNTDKEIKEMIVAYRNLVAYMPHIASCDSLIQISVAVELIDKHKSIVYDNGTISPEVAQGNYGAGSSI